MHKKNSLKQEDLLKVLKYDKETGILYRRITTSSRAKAGSIAGTIDLNGYIKISVFGVPYSAHRLVWLYIYGEFPEHYIDHINHNRNDNRIENLRCITMQENNMNKSLHKNNTSKVTGIYWSKNLKKWYAQIRKDKKTKCLGYFIKKEDAIMARKDAEKKEGYHKNHGKKKS